MLNLKTQVRKHAAEIRSFRRNLFSHHADASDWLRTGDPSQMARIARLGPINSVVNRHAELTFVGDNADQAARLDDPSRDGTVLTLSVAAHHRQLRSRLAVDNGEAEAWIAEILGAEWAHQAWAAGALSTTGEPHQSAQKLTTLFFYVFIGADGKAQETAPEFDVPLRRLAA